MYVLNSVCPNLSLAQHSRTRLCAVLCALSISVSINANAQESDSAKPASAPESAQEVEASSEQDNVEQIEVVGRAGDAALQAFEMGNFELAEIKFKENVQCALRAERNLMAFADDARNAQINQSLSNSLSSADQGAPGTSTIAPSSVTSGTSLQNKGPVREVTCSDRGYQVYMVGMSQLQLGRTEEAEENFESAIRLNKHLHDAMYRLALMKLLRQDVEGANEHFEDMQRLLKRCNNLCDAQANIEERLAFLEQALSGNVRLQ
ncbi:hypothetical protein PN836_017715 [Ningiella sp. W23]|uniref:hypothetical protein n=1 Tax=Ningiella sp. W23 TaxID=3023715 RepID=UPI0037583523